MNTPYTGSALPEVASCRMSMGGSMISKFEDTLYHRARASSERRGFWLSQPSPCDDRDL